MTNNKSKSAPIFVLGGDGYLGWPLSLSLARSNWNRRIILVDNLQRRQLVKCQGADSVLPIRKPAQRLQAAKDIHGLTNLEFLEMNVDSPALEVLVAKHRPVAIYHLAQQASATYSMRGCEEALFTLRNNEQGNMRLLWAVKEYVPDCHIIKLGSFGEYALSGMDVAEGYFKPQYGNNTAVKPAPYPREADDFYHVSKINDTNYISAACRTWGLCVTDVMQATVFGTWTADIGKHESLYTRLDYGECFGTVLNRFVTQAIRHLPLTVYGTGHQRTGLMSLNDTVCSLAQIWHTPPDPGGHHVINHLTEDSYSINELAEMVRILVAAQGFDVPIACGIYDPRDEQQSSKLDYAIERRYILDNMIPERLETVVSRALEMLLPFRQRINVDLFTPTTQWDKPLQQARTDDVLARFATVHKPRDTNSDTTDEKKWSAFRQQHFPYQHINLNPGTLGSPSRDVLDAMENFEAGETLATPLHQYGGGDDAMRASTVLASRLWPSANHISHVSMGASVTANLLALALARLARGLQRPVRLLTTAHEHGGGIGAFEAIPEIEVHYLPEECLRHSNALEEYLLHCQPDAGLFSHMAYDSGHIYPISHWARLLKHRNPECLVIGDVSQSLGLLDLPFEDVDVLFGSAHKWLFGPRGTGLLWTNKRFRRQVGGINWSIKLDEYKQPHPEFSLTGGMDFTSMVGLEKALLLYRQLGGSRIRARSASLAGFLRPRLGALLDQSGIDYKLSEPLDSHDNETGVLTLTFPEFDPYPLYYAMNQNGLHVKCIKDKTHAGQTRQLLRFGCPYYETQSRLEEALAVIHDCLPTARAADTGQARQLSQALSQEKLRASTAQTC